MNTMQTVSAIQYECKVYEGVMDAIHSRGETIKEIFIPSHSIIINSKGGLFHAEEPRNVESVLFRGEPEVEKPLKDIQLPLKLVEKIVLVANLKLEISNKEKEITSDLKKIWG